MRLPQLRENRIYIFPTRSGLLLLAAMIVLILVAATYNNNLIFLLAFFLFSLFFVSMIQTHYNLKGVVLQFSGAQEGFAGEHVGLLFGLLQSQRRLKPGIQVRTQSKEWKTKGEERRTLRDHESRVPIRILVEAVRRGVHPLPTIVVETTFPLGLFRAWKVFRPQGEMIVYPKPIGDRELFAKGQDQGLEERSARTSFEGDFGELKPYRDGESYNQIAWKQFARAGQLMSKTYWGESRQHYHLPWQNSGDLESDLSQMSAWVQLVHRQDATFEMELPTGNIDTGRGEDHARRCWEKLARVAAKGKVGQRS